MRKVFREFYSGKEVDLNNLNENILIVLDANVLLNIYRYSNQTRETFISSIDKVKNNVWIPYQVGFEFNFNRREVMESVKNAPTDLRNSLDEILEENKKNIKTLLDNYVLRSSDVKEIKKSIKGRLDEHFSKFQKEILSDLFKELFDVVDTEEDKLNSLIEILNGKVSDSLTNEEIISICKSGKERYEKEIPPGYKDNKKGEQLIRYNDLSFESKYGDLVVWNEIIKHVNEDESINTVIFVTDDNKEDWWYEIRGKTIGPRVELKKELLSKANADLIMMNSNTFLRNVNENQMEYIEPIDTKHKDYNFIKELLPKTNRKSLITYKKISIDVINEINRIIHQDGVNKDLIYIFLDTQIEIEELLEEINYYLESSDNYTQDQLNQLINKLKSSIDIYDTLKNILI